VADGVDLGPTGGIVWSDPDEWARRRTAHGCIICRSGGPLNVIAETATCWITADPEAPLPGYVCVVARVHVVEPYDMSAEDQSHFWHDAMTVARAVATVDQPIKMNYEIHGNTLPHLHLHLFPRHADDPYVGGPVDPRHGSVVRTDAELDALRSTIRAAVTSSPGS
jgi:diadenosine tetraphosphate (Ap4A) HIT family hydrolase